MSKCAQELENRELEILVTTITLTVLVF